MPAALLGRKLGMTRYFTDKGVNLPVTVIEAGPCAVTQVKTAESDQYAAVQLAFDDIKPRRSTQPMIGHDHKAGTSPKRWHRELRLDDDKSAGEYELGQTIDVSTFEDVMYVDVTGLPRGGRRHPDPPGSRGHSAHRNSRRLRHAIPAGQ